MVDRLAHIVREFSGAHAVRLSDRGGVNIPEHAHDWPVLSLYVMGSYRNWSEIGESVVSGPSAMFYRPGERHSNAVGRFGLEQVDLEFDPAWLGMALKRSWSPVANWKGGFHGLLARKLARLWTDPATREVDLANCTREFLCRCFDEPPARAPEWLPDVVRVIDAKASITTAQIACALDLNPGWLAERYRAAVGEGIGETVRRRRIEIAVQILASSSEPQAQVAAAAGFCDQSHMIRAFQAVLGRTPGEIRRDRLGKQPN